MTNKKLSPAMERFIDALAEKAVADLLNPPAADGPRVPKKGKARALALALQRSGTNR